jgi:hypothetical protein
MVFRQYLQDKKAKVSAYKKERYYEKVQAGGR